MCADRRCTDGITWCRDCNGFGYLTMGGRKYRQRSGAKNLLLSTTKRRHEPCAGTGERECTECAARRALLVGAA